MASAVAARLDSIKANAGVQSKEIAQLLDTTPQTISRWQQGKVDPHSGKPFRLVSEEGRFVIHSIGDNLADERGLYDPKRMYSGGPDDVGACGWDLSLRRQEPRPTDEPE